MYFGIKKNDFKIYFRYYRHDDRQPYAVKCIIHNITQGKDVASGMSYVHPNDAFVKDTGRRVALERAIEDMGWVGFGYKEYRKHVWAAYNNRQDVFKQGIIHTDAIIHPNYVGL